jgi:hypothetical protein
MVTLHHLFLFQKLIKSVAITCQFRTFIS